MAKSKRPSSAYKNVLLAQLSREHSEALDRHFEPVVLETKQHIYEPGK